MKKNIDEATSLLEINNINLSKIFWRKENQDQEYQHERGHALIEITSKSKALLIDYGASNHMMSSNILSTPTRAFPSTWEMTLPSSQKDKV